MKPLIHITPSDSSIPCGEEALIRLAMLGDLDAFNQLVLANQDLAYHHAHYLLGDPADAQDAVQESFIKAFQGLHGFRGGSFRAWLLQIVTNSSYDMLRRSQRRPTQPLFPEDRDGVEMESLAWLSDPGGSVQDAVEQNELAMHLYRTLDRLPHVYHDVLMLIDVYELDYAEAAEFLEVPLGTVKSRLARARLQMQARLTGERTHERNPDIGNGSTLTLAIDHMPELQI
jgi:RNA polymerase sigma-70 factor (ECF subfamily)